MEQTKVSYEAIAWGTAVKCQTIGSNEGASPSAIGCFPQALSEPCEQLSLHTALRTLIGK
jgi:hypothetical protein